MDTCQCPFIQINALSVAPYMIQIKSITLIDNQKPEELTKLELPSTVSIKRNIGGTVSVDMPFLRSYMFYENIYKLKPESSLFSLD